MIHTVPIASWIKKTFSAAESFPRNRSGNHLYYRSKLIHRVYQSPRICLSQLTCIVFSGFLHYALSPGFPVRGSDFLIWLTRYRDASQKSPEMSPNYPEWRSRRLRRPWWQYFHHAIFDYRYWACCCHGTCDLSVNVSAVYTEGFLVSPVVWHCSNHSDFNSRTINTGYQRFSMSTELKYQGEVSGPCCLKYI